MRFIEKGPEPDVIGELRRTPGATWAGVHGEQKAAMRAALRPEQRGLCAYCMRRLPPGARTTVEHWSARSDPGTDPFHWPDLLAVCEGRAGLLETCDRRRKDTPLTLHPARRAPDIEAAIRFRADGRLKVDDPDLAREARDVLGLDAPLLVAARKQALDAVIAMRKHPKRLRRKLAEIDAAEGNLPEYPTFLRPWIVRQLAKDAAIRRG